MPLGVEITESEIKVVNIDKVGGDYIFKGHIVTPISRSALHEGEIVDTDAFLRDIASVIESISPGERSIAIALPENPRYSELLMNTLTEGGFSIIFSDTKTSALRFAYPAEKKVAIISINESKTYVSIVKEDGSFEGKEFPFGIVNFIHAIRELAEDLTESEAKKILFGEKWPDATRYKLKDMSHKIKGTIDVLGGMLLDEFPEYFQGEEKLKIIISGEGALLPGITEAFRERFSTQVETIDPLQGFKIEEGIAAPPGYSIDIALGIAIEAIESEGLEKKVKVKEKEKVKKETKKIAAPAKKKRASGVLTFLIIWGILLGGSFFGMDYYLKSLDKKTKNLMLITPKSYAIPDFKNYHIIRALEINLMNAINKVLPESTWFTALNEISRSENGILFQIDGMTALGNPLKIEKMFNSNKNFDKVRIWNIKKVKETKKLVIKSFSLTGRFYLK